MKVTNILSSHYPGSFNQALLDAFVEGLQEAGHEHATVDLYGSNYDPVMKGDDFNQFFGKPLPEDTVSTHELLKSSDVVTFFYPVWWNDMPAIMKGWIDRIFTKGFAYEVTPEGQKGILPFQKVILACTLGNTKEAMHPSLEQAMRDKESQGVFGYCGVQEVDHHFFYDVDNKSLRDLYLATIRDLGRQL